MSGTLVQILGYFLIAVIWLFFLRVMRVVWAEMRPQKAAGAPRPAPPPRAEPRGGLRLEVVEPPEQRGRVFDVVDEVTLGRAAGCGVALPEDRFTSQLHARLWLDGGQLWVEDLGSTNGTFVNSTKVGSPARLAKGDRLQVGRTVLKVGEPVDAGAW